MSTLDSIEIKRQVTVKTLVTEGFKKQAQDNLAKETQLIESQLEQLETQYQNTLQQLEALSQQGQNVKQQLAQLNQEVQNKRNQLTSLKMEVTKQLNNIDQVANGDYITTGILESFASLKVGDNIFDTVQKTEVLIDNGIVQEIRVG